jgi:hypothetical protein
MARELPDPDAQERAKTPTHDQIAQRAYEIFVERGRPEGRDQEHWLLAESQLCQGKKLQPSISSTTAVASRKPANSTSKTPRASTRQSANRRA